MRSTATLAITWVKPELAGEEWEFSSHPDKQEFYRRHGLTWETLVSSFEAGCLVAWPRGGTVEGVPVTGSHHQYNDYARYLARAKRGYRRNYTLMEEALQREGHLTLPAPIVLRCGDEALLFSGWRRLCLAWNCGMAPGVWLVPLPGGDVSCA